MKKNLLISIWVLVAVVVIAVSAYFLMRPTTKISVVNTPKTEDVFYVTLVNKPDVGNYLVAPNGMTLYYFTKDEASKSNCYDACSKNWPPFSVLKAIEPGQGVADQFSSLQRTDGIKQVVYKGHPLYFWLNDKKAGDTTGQGVNKVWFVAQP